MVSWKTLRHLRIRWKPFLIHSCMGQVALYVWMHYVSSHPTQNSNFGKCLGHIQWGSTLLIPLRMWYIRHKVAPEPSGDLNVPLAFLEWIWPWFSTRAFSTWVFKWGKTGQTKYHSLSLWEQGEQAPCPVWETLGSVWHGDPAVPGRHKLGGTHTECKGWCAQHRWC